MADNVASGEAFTAAADEVVINGVTVKAQRVKAGFGQDGSYGDVSSINPLPVYYPDANVNGPATRANSVSITFATDEVPLKTINGAAAYEIVGPSVTDQVLGSTGGNGDQLSHLVFNPATTTPGNVVVKDGSTTLFTFAFGTLANTLPFTLFLGINSVNGGFKISTGLNMTVGGVGKFT